MVKKIKHGELKVYLMLTMQFLIEFALLCCDEVIGLVQRVSQLLHIGSWDRLRLIYCKIK